MRVEPSRDGPALEYRPCRVVLNHGHVIDRVYVIEAMAYIRTWGVWPDEDPGKHGISIDDVASIEESPARLPARLANKMYAAGESAMGGCIFTLILNDGRRIVCGTGGAVDVPGLPVNVTPDLIVDLLPHEGRLQPYMPPPNYYWCLYSKPNSP